MPSANLKIDTYYDLQCDICGFNRSTDFEFGMEQNKVRLRKLAKAEGWKFNSKEDKNICPNCAKKTKA